MDNAALMTKALRLRRELGEDSCSPIDIFALAQNIENLTLVYYPMGDNLSGICIKSECRNCTIAINSTMTLGRQRFSLAHEFYHMFFDDSLTSVCAKNIESENTVENDADTFASYFLMPATELYSKVDSFRDKHADKKLTIYDVVRIEQYFGVSHQAVLIRLKNEGLLDRQSVDAMMTVKVRQIAEHMGYSSELYRPLPEEKQYKTYGHYISLAKQALDEELISDGKYEELLLSAFRSDLVFGEDDEGGDVID